MNLHICKLHPNAITPTYATDGSACFDLYAATVNGSAAYKNVDEEVLRIEEGIYGEVYEAMIAAAPLPPTSAEGVEHG